MSVARIITGPVMDSTLQDQTQENAHQGSDGTNMVENGASDENSERETLVLTMKRIFNNALKADTVIQVFGPYVASPNDSRQTQTRICSQQFRQFYQDLSPIDATEKPRF